MAAAHTQVVFAVVVLCAALVSLGSAQQHFFKQCPAVIETVPNLEMRKLSHGSWFVVGMTDLNGFKEMKPRCLQTTFTPDLAVITEFTVPNGTEYTLRGQLKSTDREGAYKITHESIVTSGEIPYNFLSVDYDDFALIFGCYEFDKQPAVSGWLLSRSPELSKAALKKFEDKFESLGISFPTLVYHDVEQNGCKKISGTNPPVESTSTDEKITDVPVSPSASSPESTPGNKPTKASESPVYSSPSNTESTPRNEQTYTPESPVASSTPIAGQGSASTQTSPPPTIQVVYGGEGQGETWGYIRSLLAAQWGMLVALLLLGLLVVMSSLVVYRMLLPYLRAPHYDETRTLVFAPSDDPKSKKSGHYNDGLDVDV